MSLKNANQDQVRINVCNNQSYVMTAALGFTTLGNAVLQGFATSAGDGGKAIFTSNLNSATQFTNVTVNTSAFIDLIFASTAAANANHMFLDTANVDTVYIRCVFHGSRNIGLGKSVSGGANLLLFECEAYDNNKSNTATNAGFVIANTAGGVMFAYNCYSHDNSTGSAGHGFSATNASGLILVNCICDTNAGSGVLMVSTARNLVSINSNYYNNTVDGINLAQSSTWPVIINNNFLLNAGKGINNTNAFQGGIIYNNGRGSGTQANGAVDALGCIVNTNTDITYASNVTPWNAPTTGDFRTTLSAAKGVGRGVFTETDGTNTGTVGYPDIGAAPAQPDEGMGALMGGLRATT